MTHNPSHTHTIYTQDDLSLVDLKTLNPSSIQQLIEQLCLRGFACVTLDDEQLNLDLQAALDEAASLQGFRFPPIDQAGHYNTIRRKAFRALFQTATICLSALLEKLQAYTHTAFPHHLMHALKQVHQGNFPLFGSQFDQHEPFSKQQAFAQTFFNLFNYNHGALNAHVDRSLLTVIRARSFRADLHSKSALWVKDRHDQWHNADQAAHADQVIIMVGEDFEALMQHHVDLPYSLFAAEHAVRVNPTGEYISHSHFRPDPETYEQNNRLSAALILRHDPNETISH